MSEMTTAEYRQRVQGSERDEQTMLFRWAFFQATKYPQLDAMFAIPNGGHRDIRVAQRMKGEGVKAGIPDIFLPVPTFNDWKMLFAGLFIELKVGSNDTTPEQDQWLKWLHHAGYAVTVAYGWESAAAALVEYLTEPANFVSGP